MRAWVTPHEAGAILPEVRHGGHVAAVTVGGAPETVVPLTPAVEQWARQQTGERGRLCVTESVIAEGDSLYLLGWSYDHDGVPVLRSQPPQHRLTLSTLSEQQLVDLLGTRSNLRSCLLTGSLAATGLGVLLVLLGILWSMF